MAARVGVFVDVSNQFYCINKRWPGRKLNYEAYRAKAETFGTIVRAFAYGTQIDDSASKFISCLYHFGFEPQYKNIEKDNWYCWDVGIAMDMVRMHEKLDIVVLGTSNKSMAPVISYLKEKGVRVVVMGCGISREVKDTCDEWIEIKEVMLEQEEKQESVN